MNSGKKQDIPIQLVITVALKKELPLDWLTSIGHAVFSLAALKAGARFRNRDNLVGRGVLLIVTGVGARASNESAQWIKEIIRPLFVINVGTAGTLSEHASIGEWVIPNKIKNESGAEITVDTHSPVACHDAFNVIKGGTLLSVSYALSGDAVRPITPANFVDMEGFAQAQVFNNSGIAFNALKLISDNAGANACQQYQANLHTIRAKMRHFLQFLEGPGAPQIAVIIPTHNRCNNVSQAITSVLKQTLTPHAIIVVDDASTDSTMQQLAQFSTPVKVLTLPVNKGVSYARNRGIDAVQSPWIALLDSDDTWAPNKLQQQWEFLLNYPFYNILQSDEMWIRNGTRVNPCRHHSKPEGWIWSSSLQRCMISPSAVLLQKKMLQDCGGFDESLPVCEDYDLWIRIARNYIVGLVREQAVVKHGGHADQLSRRFPAMDKYRVTALLKALRNEEDEDYIAALVAVLKEKLQILLQGSEKRHLLKESQEYKGLLQSLPSI